ncbi:arginase family protein, partial [Nocardia neocaledoniensis]|uniref:arginase family protein n=1 Tax=Nocardia neocaledoniensis TaxID=236511 RepID=UPI002457CF4B
FGSAWRVLEGGCGHLEIVEQGLAVFVIEDRRFDLADRDGHAPQPGVALPTIQAVCDQVTASGKLAVVDVAELNPELDIDQRTARTAARLIHRIVTGHRRDQK